jgi:hypothetical protein
VFVRTYSYTVTEYDVAKPTVKEVRTVLEIDRAARLPNHDP